MQAGCGSLSTARSPREPTAVIRKRSRPTPATSTRARIRPCCRTATSRSPSTTATRTPATRTPSSSACTATRPAARRQGRAHLNCASPSKVGNDVIVGEPHCDFGRGPEECVPGPFIRTNDYPRIVTNTQNRHLYAVWQDYRNQEYDIQLSQSLDGGLTWTEVGTVNRDRGVGHGGLFSPPGLAAPVVPARLT